MLFKKFLQPQIAYGGGGGGGSSSSSSSRAPTSSPRPKPRPAPKPSSGGRNRDADNFAGSRYAPTKNAGTSKAYQTTSSSNSNRNDRTSSKVTGSTKSFNSKSSVSAKDLASGNVSKYKAKSGTGSLTVSKGTSLAQAPTVNVGVNGGTTRSNQDVYDSKDVAAPTPVVQAPSDPVKAPPTIEPEEGVGGGRDGGKAKRSKASKTNEDNVAITRKSAGVSRYRTAGTGRNPMTINKRKT